MDEKIKELEEKITQLQDDNRNVKTDLFSAEQSIKDLESGIIKLIKVVGHETRF